MKGKVATMGIWAALQVLQAGAGADGTAEPDTLVFGPVRVGTEAVDTVRIRNTGAVDLLVASATLPDSVYTLPTAPFSGDSILLGPAGVLDLPVRFAPPDTGRFARRLEVGTNGGSVGVDLDGEGAFEVVVINEILADPPSGEAGNANGDSIRHSSQDEFVELLNIGLRSVELSGWQLTDKGTAPDKRFTFPPETRIGPGERVVLFGGGTPEGIEGQVFTDDGKLGGGLKNSGDAVYLIDQSDTLARATYGSEGDKDQSLVRHPEGRGGFVRHSLFPANGALFSPGAPRIMLSGIEILPSDTSVALGETFAFDVKGIFGDGEVRTLGDEVSWEVSDATVLALEDGHAEARGLGEVGVTALAGGLRSPEARVEVVAPGLAGLVLVPSETLVLVGDSVVYAVEGVYSDSSRERIDGGLAWTVSDSSVARPVGGNGVLALGPGSTVVWAGLEALLGEALLRAAEVGDLNADGTRDLLDALHSVHLILDASATLFERRAADLNGDGEIDIFDLAKLIGWILGKPIAGAKAVPPGIATWRMEEGGTVLSVEIPVALRAIFLEVEGPVEEVRLKEGGEAVLTARRTPHGTLKALIYTLSEQGVRGRDGQIGLSLSDGEQVGDPVDVVSIQGVDLRGARVGFQQAPALPTAYALSQNHPNPFNSATVIAYDLPQESRVALRIFSCLGQEVARLVDGSVRAGTHRVYWDGRDRRGRRVASGVYLVCLEADTYRAVVKMVLLR